MMNNVHNIFKRQRLKIELVAGGIVGRDRFGVIVYDDCLKPRLLNCFYRVYGGVVKLNTLTDANRSAAENDYLLLVTYG